MNSLNPKLLLLGGSHAEIPLILAAKELGYYVITTGNDQKGLGHSYANKNIFADFSDKKAMLELATTEKIDAICSGCNDFALLSTAYVAEKLSLPGHDSYEIAKQIHHKDKYRKLAESLEIPTPKSIRISTIEELEKNISSLQFPIIIKPVDLTGGKGIQRADSIEEAKSAFTIAMEKTRENYCIAEEFIEGKRHGFSCYINQEKVVFYFADNEQYFLNQYLVSGANTPSTSSQNTLEMLKEYSERIAKKLHLVDGILHIQYIEKDNGIPFIIEVCRRPPGDLYIKLVKHATQLDYPKMLVLAETGRANESLILDNFSVFSPYRKPRCVLRHCIMAKEKGKIKGIYFAKEIQNKIIDLFLWYKEKEFIEDPLHDKAGIVFLSFDSENEMEYYTENISDYIKIIFE